jgi:DNA-binding IclR family transcriptional regulator
MVWLAANPGGGWSVRQVARDIGTSPTTVHRIFRVLEERGLIVQDADRSYRSGLELYRIAQALAGELSPAKVARPHLERLAEQCEETALLGVYDPSRRQMTFVEIVYAPHPLRYVIELNQWVPIHAGATGLAILANLSETERQAVYDRGLPALTESTLSDSRQLEQVSRQIREQGFAFSHGQRLPGAVALAAPVFDAAGDVYGDTCITIPEQRYDEALKERILPALLQAAAKITADLERVGVRRG